MNRLLSLVVFVVALVAADRALHALAPVDPSTVGHRRSANAALYGWGYDPGERIRLRDPDTGEVFADALNNHGWRDRDREYDAPGRRLRILALGDSNTFGVIVPGERTWTHIVEDRLRAEGHDVEVINVAYSQWGTDQELEALRREGVRYAPDLIVLQFTINDLFDNTEVVRGARARKPFYYTLGPGDALERHDNPDFARALREEWRDPFRLASRSEIFKRAYIALDNARFSSRPRYFVRPQQLAQLQTVLALETGDAFYAEMAKHAGSALAPEALDAAIARTGRQSDRETILRILENHLFKEAWMLWQYRGTPPARDGGDWRLALRLIGEIKTAADAAGAEMALLSDHEQGLYEWERYWHRLAPGEEVMRSFLAPTAWLEEFCRERGIGFVANRRKHVRARNDSHPNREGTEAMALNVLAYLRSHGFAPGKDDSSPLARE